MDELFAYVVTLDNGETHLVDSLDDLYDMFGEAVTSITRYKLVEETAISINTMEPFIGG